ncbi:MAG: dienelactone hydrolase family protein [Candidatus Omnitrophica bacterium]|nr:dienelactone hydrolase family protein [Candidatus Omnitrophota bacterium]
MPNRFLKALLLIVVIFSATNLFAQPYIIEQLDNSPRHHEWVEIASGERTVHSFVVYPEVSENAPVVIVIHENRGLTDWVRLFADQLAEAGYVAVAPDLLSDFSEEYSRTSDFPSSDAARNGIYELNPSQVTADLMAVQAYAQSIAAANGKTAVVGFCWGGKQSFRFATNNTNIKTALVFYGTAPESEEELNRIQVPVHGFYGGDDQRVNATIDATAEQMTALDKKYDYEIYPGAGHAFMRKGDDPEGSLADHAARDAAWKRIKDILRQL